MWAPICGIVEPGEQPADRAVREVAEETGVSVEAQRLAGVESRPPVVCSNGDRAQFLDLTFRCRYLSGRPYAADDESLDVRWFELDHFPPMRKHHLRRIQRAMPPTGEAWFSMSAAPDLHPGHGASS